MTKKESIQLPVQTKQNREDGVLPMPGWEEDELWHQRGFDEIPLIEKKTLLSKKGNVHFSSDTPFQN